MDISSPMDCNSQIATNFDMEILTSMTNTDLLVRLIKDQEAETVVLKNQLSSLNSSALQMKNCYTSERTKNDHIEKENRQLLMQIKTLEENISQLENNLLNDAALHKQKTAGLENSLASAYRHLMIQRNVLKANHLSIKDPHQHYNNAKEFLTKRGEVVVEDIKDVKVISKKQKAVNASTMTDQCDSLKPKEVKQFCDKATMHCPMVSTATRGTTTSTFIKQADAATNFPEPMTIDVDEIFRIMIDDMPPAITPIEDLPSKTQCTQTEPPAQLNVGTITRIKNIRRKINCASEYTQPLSASSPLCRVKKEKDDSIPDLLNLDYSGNGSPINQQLTKLWQMVGQMIFGIIGSGEVFNHSNNISLINDNLNQIRRVIEMESQPETQFHSFVDEQRTSEDFNIATAVAGSGIGNSVRQHNALDPVDIDESLLVRNSFKARPLICDYLRQRETQLQVDVYCGSIDTQHDCLLNTDVVIGIEIIEHLYPETIENVPYNIFGFMKPKVALFTTPNSECNVLFNMTEKFRHDDHKFEWTREQFEDWAYNICTRFPDYKVAFYGIGPGPDGTEHLGCCSQMALFVRCDFYDLTSNGCGDTTAEGFSYNSNQLDLPQVMKIQSESVLTEHVIINKESASEKSTTDDINRSISDEVEEMIVDMATTHIDMESYRLVTTCIYPKNMDDRSQEQKIFDEACFHLSRYMNLNDDHYDADNDIIKVPVKRIFELVYKFTSDINEFRYVMRKNNYTIDEDDVFLIKPMDTESDEEDDMPANCVDALPRQVASSDEDWD